MIPLSSWLRKLVADNTTNVCLSDMHTLCGAKANGTNRSDSALALSDRLGLGLIGCDSHSIDPTRSAPSLEEVESLTSYNELLRICLSS
uniref:POLIIIAc domain-containing protein n=1 Tax=Steinernema glaseri TaxID=37863 RepID=A0A1I7YTS1_9BILA